MISLTMRFLFVMGITLMSMHAVRLSYLNWYMSTDSLIAEDLEVREERKLWHMTLEQLAKQYKDAKEKVKAYEEDAKNPKIGSEERYDKEPYRTMIRIAEAINEREAAQHSMFRHWYFWGMGLTIVIGGLVLFTKINAFAGQTFVIAGFSVMIGAVFTTSGSYRMGYEAFTLIRFISSLLTIISLAIAAWITGLFTMDDREA